MDRSTPVEGVIFHLWTDPDEINTAYVKIEGNYFLFMNFFGFRYSLLENYDFHFIFSFFFNFKRKEVKK